MHLVRCIAVSAEGGFKIINGPPRIGKGPMESEEYQKMNKGASPSRPTQTGRIELCTELIRQAMRYLENNDKDCVMKLIEELVRNQCHNGYAVGREVADKAKDAVHELWLSNRGDDEWKCELPRMLKSLNVTKGWIMDALHKGPSPLNKWLTRCGISWEGKTSRNNVIENIENMLKSKFSWWGQGGLKPERDGHSPVPLGSDGKRGDGTMNPQTHNHEARRNMLAKEIEEILRRRLGWNEIMMDNIMWRFIGVNANVFLDYGIDPHIWLQSLNGLGDLENEYWFGAANGDLYIMKWRQQFEVFTGTSSAPGVFYFLKLMETIKRPSVKIVRIGNYIEVQFYVLLRHWPWYNVNYEAIKDFNTNGLARYLAGLLDTDGSVISNYEEKKYYRLEIRISACKNCDGFLKYLRSVVYEKLGIRGNVSRSVKSSELRFQNRQAVELFRYIRQYVIHPLKRLRAEVYLRYYDKELTIKEYEYLYEPLKYDDNGNDPKRNHAVDALTQAAPQTHTHGEKFKAPKNMYETPR